jgi:Ni2+-binding GTPase involved in maturation of urease and hydrogenase
LKAPPNTNLLYPKTFVPQLRGEIGSGETVLMAAAVALTDRFDVATIWKDVPPAPAIDELEALMSRDSRRVGALVWRMAQ